MTTHKIDHAATNFFGTNQIFDHMLSDFHRNLYTSKPCNHMMKNCDDVISQPESTRYPAHTKVIASRQL
jgi:hypothetical protein